MRKLFFATASVFLLGAGYAASTQDLQVVEAAERVFISETSGLYTAQYDGERKSAMKPSSVVIVETGKNGWYKVETWIGEVWVKSGYMGTKSPSKPIEYYTTTETSGLFNEMNSGVRNAAITPQRVVVLEHGTNGWVRIQTWKGPMWMKDGVMAIGDDTAVEETPSVPTKPLEPTSPPGTGNDSVVELPTEEEPVDEEPVPISTLTTRYSNDIFTSPNGTRLGFDGVKTYNVLEVGEDGWYKVESRFGIGWLKDGFVQGYEKPILPKQEDVGDIPFGAVEFPEKDAPIGFFTITKPSGMYSDPSTAERLGVVNPQRVYMIERGENGWVKINTNWGQVWIKDGYNAHRAWFADGATFYRSVGGSRVTAVNPSFINVVEERQDGWKLVETWLGNLWTKDASSLVPHKFAADNTLEHIYVSENTPIMEKMMYDYKQVGIAKGGQTYVIIGETEQSFIIDFGYGQGHIKKTHAFRNHKASYQNRITKKEGNDVIITNKDVIVYDLKGEFYHEIGAIEENMRYPIVGEVVNFYLVDFAGREGYVAKSSVKKDTTGVPALMYHHVLDASENKSFIGNSTTITPQKFEREMAILKEQDFMTLTPEMMERYITKKGNLPGKAVILTSDDGYKSNHRYMYPIAKKYGHQVSIFIVTGWTQPRPMPWKVDSQDFMALSEMKEAALDGTLNYHGHTNLKHYRVGSVGAIVAEDKQTILTDIKLSKEKLEHWGYQPSTFAYPYGSYSPQVIDIMKEAGYTSAYTVKPGYNKPGDSIYELKRWDIKPWVYEAEFKRIINGQN